MKQKISYALIALAASAALPLLAANPPAAPPAATPPPPPAAPAIPPAYCFVSGETLATCAASWETLVAAGNKVDGMKTAWEASGFESFVAGLRYENQDSSWCDPAGTETTTDDAFRAVAKYLKDNPDKLHTPPAVLVDKALHEAYPCTKKGAH